MYPELSDSPNMPKTTTVTGVIINWWYFLSVTFQDAPESLPTHTWLLLDVLFHLLQCFMLLHVVELASKSLPRSSRDGSYEVLHYFLCCPPLPVRQLKMVTKLIPVPYTVCTAEVTLKVGSERRRIERGSSKLESL